MDILNNFSATICITLTVGTILSYLTPKNANGEFYKSAIRVFIILAFLTPLINSDFNYRNDFDYQAFAESTQCEVVQTANNVVNRQIEIVLKDNNINGSIIQIESHNNDNNEISIDDINILVPDEYDCEAVKNLLYDKLSLNVDVTHIG